MARKFKFRKEPYSVKGLAMVYRHDPTKSEARFTVLLKKLEKHGYSFQRSWAVGPYIADFFDKKHRLAIELDGYVHREARQRVHDQNRDKWFEQQGIQVIRIPSALVMTDPSHLMRALTSRLKISS